MTADTDIAILVPLRTTIATVEGAHRIPLWELCCEWWQQYFPSAAIVTATDITPELEASSPFQLPFSRATAINRAAAAEEAKDAEVLVIADADIIPDLRPLEEAIGRAQEIPHFGLHVPYNCVRHLSKHFTETCIYSESDFFRRKFTEFAFHTTHTSTSFGGVNVVSRQSFERVGGFDERFVGWGGEDDAFKHSLEVAVGKTHVIPGCITHLWHPTTSRETDQRDGYYDKNLELLGRYWAADMPEFIDDLIAERGK